MTLLDPFLLALLVVAAAVGALLVGWSWLRPREAGVGEPPWLQPAILVLLAAGGVAWALWLRSSLNPEWLPVGQDAWDFLSYPLSYLDPELGSRTDTRHPLAPWLAVRLYQLSGLGLHQAVLLITVVATGLLPLVVYLLVRPLAPWPVALVGALLATLQPLVIGYATQPSVYPFAAVLRLACLALVLALARVRGPTWPAALALGAVLGALMGTVLSSLPTLLVCGGAAVGLVGWRVAWQRRWWDLTALPALLLPIVAAWILLAPTAHERSCLEGSTHAVAMQEYRSFMWEHGHEVPEPGLQPPDGVGWSLEDRLHDWGWWKVGSPDALTRLPQIARYFTGSTRAPAQARAFGEHLAGAATEMVRQETGAAVVPLVVLVILAFAGFTRGSGRHRWLPWLLAVLAGVACLLPPVKSAFELAPRPRYLYELVACTPALLLAGVVAPLRLLRKRGWAAPAWPWLLLVPAVAAAWWFGGYDALPARAQARLQDERNQRATHPLRQVAALAEGLQPGDRVVDLAESCAHGPAAMLWHRAEVVGGPVLRLPSHGAALAALEPGARRFFVLDCAWIPEISYEPERDAVVKALSGSPRIRRHTRCILEDREPERPLVLAP